MYVFQEEDTVFNSVATPCRWRLLSVQSKEDLPFAEQVLITGLVASKQRQLHCISGRLKAMPLRQLLVLPVGPSVRVLDHGELAVQFVHEVRACFPSLVRRNPLTYQSDDDDDDDESDVEDGAKQQKKNGISKQQDNTKALEEKQQLFAQTKVKLLESVEALCCAYAIMDKAELEASLRDHEHPALPRQSPFHLLCMELPAVRVTASTMTPTDMDFGLLFSTLLSTQPHNRSMMDIVLLRGPRLLRMDSKRTDDLEGESVFQDAHVYSFNTHREATAHGGGKTSEEMVQNIRMRHASGTFCTMVLPTTTWNDVQTKYATVWPEIQELHGSLRLRRIMGLLPNEVLRFQLEH